MNQSFGGKLSTLDSIYTAKTSDLCWLEPTVILGMGYLYCFLGHYPLSKDLHSFGTSPVVQWLSLSSPLQQPPVHRLGSITSFTSQGEESAMPRATLLILETAHHMLWKLHQCIYWVIRKAAGFEGAPEKERALKQVQATVRHPNCLGLETWQTHCTNVMCGGKDTM